MHYINLIISLIHKLRSSILLWSHCNKNGHYVLSLKHTPAYLEICFKSIVVPFNKTYIEINDLKREVIDIIVTTIVQVMNIFFIGFPNYH